MRSFTRGYLVPHADDYAQPKLTADHDWLHLEARSSAGDGLRNEGVDGKLGGIDRFTTVADAVEGYKL